MSIIAQQSTGTAERYPSVRFKAVGDSVAGRIVSTEDYQETVFGAKPPFTEQDYKFFPSGDPIMGVRITLEMTPGDEDTRVTLWAQGSKMLKAIAAAVKGTGAGDLIPGDDLAVTFTGYDGRAKVYQAAYGRADA